MCVGNPLYLIAVDGIAGTTTCGALKVGLSEVGDEIGLYAAGGKGNTWTGEQFDLIARRFSEYARFGADNGFRVGPESHWGPELVPDNMERLAKAVNHPGFGILLHIGHWEQAPGEEGDRRLAPWAAHTHVDAAITRTRLEPAMRALLAAGYRGFWGVEHHSGRNEYAEVECQIAEVRRVLQKLRLEEEREA